MIVSTVVYNCWINVPSMIGKKKINSCFQITPSVIAFFSIVFLPQFFSPSPAFLPHFFVFLPLCNFPLIQFQMSDIPTFITPARTITHIGFIFTFRSNIIQTTKITTRLHFVPASAIRSLFSQNAVIRIEIPADAIIATTAGLKDPSTPCNTSILRYFKYSFAMTVTIIQEGRMHPNVAARAPGIPGNLDSDKGCRIHRDRSRCHLGDCNKIRKFCHAKPLVQGYYLSLDQRHCSIGPRRN